MIPVQFDYAAPESLEAAVKLLKENEKAQILAGGHRLLVEMKLNRASPSLLVDLRKIQGLQGVSLPREKDGVLQIGSMTSYAQTAAAPEVRENYRALAEAVDSIGDAQIRNWGTIGDIFAYHDLACDLSAVALALEATFNTIGSSSTRALGADELLTGSFETKLQPGEIVTSIDFPRYVSGTGSAYEKIKHPANGYTICGIAAKVWYSDGVVSQCRVAVTGAMASAMRLPQVEAALSGKAPTAENIAAAAKFATESVPATEKHHEGLTTLLNRYASAEYRAHLCGVLAERAIARASEQAGFRA
ncbi:MAG TPA: FAD binding domain-containing protein [Candidatus Obscuribacterales bacterium]